TVGNATDEEIGAGRRAGRGDARAANKRRKGGDLTELGAVIVVQGIVQIERRSAVQRRAAREYFYSSSLRELAHDNALGAAECAGEPAGRQRNAAAIVLVERNERGG